MKLTLLAPKKMVTRWNSGIQVHLWPQSCSNINFSKKKTNPVRVLMSCPNKTGGYLEVTWSLRARTTRSTQECVTSRAAANPGQPLSVIACTALRSLFAFQYCEVARTQTNPETDSPFRCRRCLFFTKKRRNPINFSHSCCCCCCCWFLETSSDGRFLTEKCCLVCALAVWRCVQLWLHSP